MTTTQPSPLVEDPYATYSLPMTSILWAAAMANSRPHQQTCRHSNSIWNGSQHTKTARTTTTFGMNSQKLEKVTSFKYLGATLCKDGTCSAEVCIRIVSAIASMASLNKICWYTPSALQASSSCTSLLSPPSSSMAVNHGPCLLTWKKGSQLLKPSA